MSRFHRGQAPTRVGPIAQPGADVVNGINSHVLVKPSDANPTANAITVKRPSHSANGWGNKDTAYGKAQVFELLSDSPNDPTDSTDPANPVLFRIDPFGGLGVCHGIHVGTGLRRQGDDVLPTQSIWVDPSIDCVGLIMDNPTTAEVPTTPTASFMLIRDVRATAYTLVEVKADGTINSNKALVAGSRLAGDIPLLVKPVAGSTALAVQVNDNAGAKRFVISATGTVAGNADDGVTNAYTFAANNLGNAGYRAILQAINAGVHVMALTSPAAYTGDHLQVVPSGGVKFRVNKAGYPIGKLNAAPVLADLSDGEYALWLDTAGNAFKISARVAGVLKTGTVAVA